MSDVETKVKVTSDVGGLREIGREARAAFSPESTREIQRKTKELERDMRDLGRTMANVAEEMRKTKRGTEEYDKLRLKLREVRDEARLVETALQGIGRATGGDGGAGRRSFIGGVVQGAGLAQYVPAEPGMGARIGGVMAGGMMRRAAGGMAAPFLMPGVGGMAAALGAIPGVGAAAGGALQQGAAYFQQAVAYDQARLGLLPYAGEGILRQVAVTRRKPEEVTTGDVSTAAGLSKAWGEERKKWGGESEKLVGGGAWGALAAARAAGAMRGARMAPEERAPTLASGAASAVGLLKTIATGGGEERITQYRNVMRAGLPSLGWGVSMGYSPMEEAGLIGGFFQARGGRYSGAARGEAVEAAAAQRRYGVGVGLAGGFGRMFMPGAGGEGGATLSGAIGTALAQGLSGSQIPEFLQTLVEQGRQAEQQGVKFDVKGTLLDPTSLLSAGGLQGLQAGRVAAGLQGAARGVSARGVTSPTDLLLARAAGYSSDQGAEGYAGAMNRLAGGMNEDVMRNLLEQLASGVQGTGMGSQMQSLLFRRALGRMGVQVGPEQAQGLISNFGGGMGIGARARRWFMGTTGGMDVGDLVKQAQTGTAGVGGLAVYAAGAQAEQIRIGRDKDFAQIYKNLETGGRTFIRALSNMSGALKNATELVKDTMKGFEGATKGAGR